MPPSSTPEPELTPSAHRHDGFFMRGGVGFGYATGKVPTDTQSAERHDPTGFGYEFLLGGTPWSGTVLGGGFVATNLDASFALVSYVAFLQLYPDPTRGLHVQALGGISLLGNGDRRLGPSGALGMGYDGWIGQQTCLGLFLRAQYTRLVATGSADPVNSVSFTTAMTFTWH